MSNLPDYSHIQDLEKMRRLHSAVKAQIHLAESSGDPGWIRDAHFHLDVATARLEHLEAVERVNRVEDEAKKNSKK